MAARKEGTSRSTTATFTALTAISLCVVVFNVSRMHAKLDASAEYGDVSAPSKHMLDRIAVTLRLRSRRPRPPNDDTEKIVQAVKIRLGTVARSEVSRDLKILAATSELNMGKRFKGATSARSHMSLTTVGLEDLDEAVERRALEMAAEEKINPSFHPGYFIKPWVTSPKWPFQLIQDRDKKDTGVIGLAAPFIKHYYASEAEKALFWRLKAQGHIMLGITSYEWYPGNATNPYTDRIPQKRPEDKRIFASMDGFLHCFREPHLHISPGIPRTLISQSDFINPKSGDARPKNLEKKHAFVYSNLAGNWNDFNRNWTLAKDCIKQAAAAGMKSVLVGKQRDLDAGNKGKAGMSRDKLDDLRPEIDSGMVELRNKMEHKDFTDIIEESEFFFLPNLSDASPRVAAEALSRNVPLLVNRHIAGGWKYVNDETGVFFSGADDFLPAVQRLRALRKAGKLRPRAWFMENYGPYITSLRLHAFLELVAGKDRMEQARRLVQDVNN